MAQNDYWGVLSKDRDSAWGIHFIEIPGAFGAGDTLEQALESATIAIEEIGREFNRPAPRPLYEVMQATDVIPGLARGEIFGFVRVEAS